MTDSDHPIEGTAIEGTAIQDPAIQDPAIQDPATQPGDALQLSAEVWAWRQRRGPRTRDDLTRLVRPSGWLPVWDAASVADDREQLGRFEERLDGLAVRDIDAYLIGSVLARARWELDVLHSWESDPWFYLDHTLGIVFDALLVPPPFEDPRAGHLLAALESIPATLDTARVNLAARGVTEFARLAIDDAAHAGANLAEAMAAVQAELPARWRAEITTAANVAVAALHGWVDWLTQVSPEWSAWEPVGPEAFGDFLTRVALVAEPASELRRAARTEWDRAVAFEELESHRPAPTGPRREAPATSAEEQCLQEAAAEAEMRRFTEAHGLLSQAAWPQRYTNLPRPAYLAPLAWLGVTDDLTDPSRLDRDGVSYVPPFTDHLPYFYRANAIDPRAGIAHEGAHYQQLTRAWASRHPTRSHYYDSIPNEGVAFYNEEMLLQAGLFDDSPNTRQVIYNFMRLRSLRVEIDIGLALGDLTIEAAGDLLAERVPMDRETARAEAAFFASNPGQGLSYQTGKTQILRLLADCRLAEGDDFSLQAWHDWLWVNGNVPLSLLRWERLGDRRDLDRIEAARLVGSPTAPEAARQGEATSVPAAVMADLAERIQTAIITGDVAAAAAIYAEDLVVWHNHDRIERTRDESLVAIANMASEFSDFTASQVRRDFLPDGYVQRCVFRGTDRAGGAPFAVEAMMRVWSDGIHVTRIEEYTDAAQGTVPEPKGDDHG
jgi:hypothetical protein